MQWLWEQYDDLDRRISSWLEEHGIKVLRYGLAIMFIWFGAVKPFGMGPATELAAQTIPWIPRSTWIPILGIWEVLIGLCFLYRPFIRIAIPLMAAHMVGTFLPFIFLPETVFSRFPFVLTLEGQYIVKNIVLIGAAMVVGGIVREHD